MEVRNPRLLGPDMAERARLRPSSASATLNLTPLSTASLTLPEGEPTVSVRDFIELYGPDGSLGVFRVASAQTAYGSQQQLGLEHGVVTLADDMAPEGVVLSGGLRGMLTELLRHQSRTAWVLGDVDVDPALDPIEAGLTNLLDAVLTVVGSDDTAMLAFDQKAFPWVLHVRKRPSAATCECRLNRNTVGVSLRLEDAELCTRVTVEDENGALHTYDADTVATWGVVHRFIAAEGDPAQAGRQYLERHKNPAVCIELDALTLASLTGEPLDRFAVGQVCRVALPEWGAAMDERIVSLRYPDLFGQPGLIRLTLVGRREDAASRLARLRGAAEKQSAAIRQNLRYYRELDDKVLIQAGEIELRATREELGQFRNEVFIKLDAADASITLHAEHLNRLDGSLSEAGIRLDGLSADLQLWARKTEENGNQITEARLDLDGANARITAQAQRLDAQGNQISAAELRMDGLAATIDLKVSKDGLISAINMSPESIRIASSRVVLDGYVTMSEFSALKAEVGSMWNGTLEASQIHTMNLVATNTVRLLGHTCAWDSQRVVTSVNSPTFNYVTLQYKDHNGNNQSQVVLTSVHTAASGNTATLNFMSY